LQEEPRNMGAWNFVAPRLQPLLPRGVELLYIGRPEFASPAEGSLRQHTAEQARILQAAVAGAVERVEAAVTLDRQVKSSGVQNAD